MERAGLLAAVAGLCLGVSACSQVLSVPSAAHAEERNQLQSELDALQAARPGVQGFAVAVVLEDGTLLSAASGVADPQGRAMTPDTPVRIASVTKTFVAAALLRLVEEGLVDLDAPLSRLISEDSDALLNADGYETAAITLRHVLMHAGGLSDHFQTDAFKGMVLAESGRVWTRGEQIAIMTATTDPAGGPGERFAYSDTGYLLLGEVIERITGEPLGEAVARLTALEANGLKDVWWDTEGMPPGGVPARAHQWLEEIDTHAIHGSVDAYGGGGIVASVEDMARFYAALFGGRVFENASTLALMTQAPGHPAGSPYRMGLFAGSRGGRPSFGHGGFWGTDVFILPEEGIVVAGVALNVTGTEDIREFGTKTAARAAEAE